MHHATVLRSRGLPTLLSLAIAMAVSTSFAAQAAEPAQAQSSTYRFDIPAQSLDGALAAFSAVTRIQVLVPAEMTQGVRSAGLSGSHAANDALARLLVGTGLAARFVDADTVTLERPADDQGVLQLGATTVTGQGLGVTTEGSGSYTTGQTTAATRLPLTLRETPQSISVITRQQMDEQNLRNISDVLQQTPGIKVNQENSEGYTFYARGFEVQNFQVDGISSLSSDGGTLRDNYSIGNSLIYDRVEVLKGATGLVNGAGYPSAVINMVRKRPTTEFQGHVAAGMGSWDRYSSEVDVSGPLSEGGAVRGRMVAGTEEHQSYIDHLKGEQHVFYGILEADLTPDTTVAVGYDVQKNYDDGSTTGSLPAFFVDGRKARFSRSSNAADQWAYRNQDTQRLFAEVEQALAGDWTLKAVVSARQYKSNELISGINSQAINTDNSAVHGFLWGEASKFNVDSNEKNLDVQAKGPFQLLGRSHDLVLGYSYNRTDTVTQRYDGLTNELIDDVFNWDNNGTKPARFDWFNRFTIDARQKIAYAATVLKPTDRLSLILGARVTDYEWEIETINAFGRRGNFQSTVSGEVTPYVGLTFALDDHHSVYASYTDIFKPQAYSRGIDGKPIDPLTGESYEIGIKGEYFDNRLNASLALFELQQDNVADERSDGSGGTYNVPVQGVKTRGVELEMSGELAERLQVQAGYVFQESHDADGNRESTNQPQHMLKLAGSYRLAGDWNRLTVGGNLQWQSSTYFVPGDWYSVDGDPKFEQKAYTLVGLMAGYDFNDQFKGSLNLNNLFDKHHYSGIGNYDTVYWGAPRNLMATLKYSF
ncbi:MAG: TonB-dependent siderophore receptor [Pseudomonas sp.]|uniref:TonB-dependent siderophore receptor n=1 Tax=Pseudomonas sp. TaxID=306 RepID=UPI003D0D4612